MPPCNVKYKTQGFCVDTPILDPRLNDRQIYGSCKSVPSLVPGQPDENRRRTDLCVEADCDSKDGAKVIVKKCSSCGFPSESCGHQRWLYLPPERDCTKGTDRGCKCDCLWSLYKDAFGKPACKCDENGPSPCCRSCCCNKPPGDGILNPNCTWPPVEC